MMMNDESIHTQHRAVQNTLSENTNSFHLSNASEACYSCTFAEGLTGHHQIVQGHRATD